MTIQTMTGRAAFLRLLIDEGVTHLFGNPGTTELAIMEVVPQFPELTYANPSDPWLRRRVIEGMEQWAGRDYFVPYYERWKREVIPSGAPVMRAVFELLDREDEFSVIAFNHTPVPLTQWTQAPEVVKG